MNCVLNNSECSRNASLSYYQQNINLLKLLIHTEVKIILSEPQFLHLIIILHHPMCNDYFLLKALSSRKDIKPSFLLAHRFVSPPPPPPLPHYFQLLSWVFSTRWWEHVNNETQLKNYFCGTVQDSLVPILYDFYYSSSCVYIIGDNLILRAVCYGNQVKLHFT